MDAFWPLALVFVIGAGVLLAGAFTAGSSARFWLDLGQIVVAEGLPKLKIAWAAYKAKHTPEEWEALREKRKKEARGGDR